MTEHKEESAFASAVQDGVLLAADAENPTHHFILSIVAELSAEFEIEPTVLFIPRNLMCPSEDMNPETISGFFAATDCTLLIPEVAEYYLNRNEIKAILIHEFDHLSKPQFEHERNKKYDAISEAIEDVESEIEETVLIAKLYDYPAIVEKITALRDYVTQFEVEADEKVIEFGYASHFISALQKIHAILALEMGDLLLEDVDPEFNLEAILSNTRAFALFGDRLKEHTEAEISIQTKLIASPEEAFSERLARLEAAAEKEAEQEAALPKAERADPVPWMDDIEMIDKAKGENGRGTQVVA